jgi:chromosome segregation ATPase
LKIRKTIEGRTTKANKAQKIYWSREKQFRDNVLLQEHLIGDLRQKIHDLEAMMNSLNHEADQVRKDLHTKEGELDQSHIQYGELCAKNQELEANLCKEIETRESTEQTIRDLNPTMKEKTREIDRLNEAIGDLRRQFRAKLKEEKQANQFRWIRRLNRCHRRTLLIWSRYSN